MVAVLKPDIAKSPVSDQLAVKRVGNITDGEDKIISPARQDVKNA